MFLWQGQSLIGKSKVSLARAEFLWQEQSFLGKSKISLTSASTGYTWNISGLMNINKILEKVTCKMVISDMKSNMDPAQFGNKKGVSIQHYLIKLLDRVMGALDRNSRGEAVAVICTMVDWRQAFCRQCPTLAIKSFIKNGVRPSLIPILISFFEFARR